MAEHAKLPTQKVTQANDQTQDPEAKLTTCATMPPIILLLIIIISILFRHLNFEHDIYSSI